MKFIICFLITALAQISIAQDIVLTGSILEREFTGDDRVAGMFTYMNNSDQTLIMESERETESGTVEYKSFIISPRSGKQIKVYKEAFSTTSAEEKVYGNYKISFYHSTTGDAGGKGALIVSYKNKISEPATLRGVGLLFNGILEDSGGKYLEVRVDWRTLHSGAQNEIRKCYLGI